MEKWEVSIIAVYEGDKIKFKVTRRMPGMSVAETKVFASEDEARKQFDEWLQ